MKKKDYINITIICSVFVALIVILLLNGKVYASVIDWSNQHYVLPEYFRNLFYETGNIFPKFSSNLGMGQNIFYFSYYGLFSPIVLLSYLFPFIPMHIYMISISIISLFSSITLFYSWIKKKYNSNIAFITTFIFALNSTFSYHFHRHLMFVIYMPFMILALKSVDLFFEKNKKLPLIISTLLMIFTSYYFSVYGILTIGIYTLYQLLKHKDFNYKKLFSVIGYVTISILLSAILLLPTIYTLLNGRLETLTDSINILDLINPINNFNYTFYNSYYSWGLTFIYVLALIRGFFSKNKERIFLSAILSIIILFPITSYILNVFMYIDGKCFIPLIPVTLLIVSEFIKDLFDNKIIYEKKYLISIPIIILLIIGSIINKSYLLILDVILCLLALYISIKTKKYKIIFIPIITISILSFILSSSNENYIKINDLQNINSSKYYNLTNINEEGLYRLSNEDYLINNPNKVYNINNNITSMYASSVNKNYMNFMRNIFQNEVINRDNLTITQTSNILFNIYSGTKYIVSNKDYDLGYKFLKEEKNTKLYLNESALPIAYARSNIMSLREFNTLPYPKNLDALLNYQIVDISKENVYKSNVVKYNNGFNLVNKENIDIIENNNHYLINANKDSKVTIKLNETLNNKIVILKFKMNKAKKGYACSSNITINGITNALSCDNWKYNNQNNTFEYVFAKQTLNTFEISFTKASYDISDIEIYTIDYNNIKNIKNNVTELILNKTSDNEFVGNLNLLEDSYLTISIPYDEGFKLYVDGKETEIIKIDTAFIGAKLNSGNHTIKLTFEPPLFNLGKRISLITLISTSAWYIIKYFKRKKTVEN